MCVKVDVPADATDSETNVATVTATSVGDPSVSGSATVTTLAVTDATLLVDEDGNSPDVQSYYADALTAAGIPFDTWDLGSDSTLPGQLPERPPERRLVHRELLPRSTPPVRERADRVPERRRAPAHVGSGILDQAAGTTAFVHDYLHVTWDGTEAQNDKFTDAVHGVTGSPGQRRDRRGAARPDGPR